MHTRTVISSAIAGTAVLVAIGLGLYWLAQDSCLDVGGALLAGNMCSTNALSSQPLFALVRPVGALFVTVVAAVLVGVPVYLACNSFLPRGSEHV